MASLTVRQLEERLKKQLRLRAARNGRSVEDEVRNILREAAEIGGLETPAPVAALPGGAGAPRSVAPTDVKRVLLIIGGGIAAYKSLDLIRRLKERGFAVRCILTAAAQHFVTQLSASALVGGRVYTNLFDPASEFDVGHIRLARDTDVIVVAPAMNPRMWANKAAQRNLARLVADGVDVVGPSEGEMAEAESQGLGRMAEPLEITAAVGKLFEAEMVGRLRGRRVLVTSGPTHEPIDPVRYIANRSSGKQGHGIAAAAVDAGADVTLISGPVNVPDPPGAKVIKIESACEMLRAVESTLPADVAIFAAAVADWRVANAGEQKLKKQSGQATPELALVENPDILATIAGRKKQRPKLVIGFAAETENVVANAKAKLARKHCDWILANDVSPQSGVMGGDSNTITLVRASGLEAWPPQSKDAVATMLVTRIADALDEDARVDKRRDTQ